MATKELVEVDSGEDFDVGNKIAARMQRQNNSTVSSKPSLADAAQESDPPKAPRTKDVNEQTVEGSASKPRDPKIIINLALLALSADFPMEAATIQVCLEAMNNATQPLENIIYEPSVLCTLYPTSFGDDELHQFRSRPCRRLIFPFQHPVSSGSIDHWTLRVIDTHKFEHLVFDSFPGDKYHKPDSRALRMMFPAIDNILGSTHAYTLRNIGSSIQNCCGAGDCGINVLVAALTVMFDIPVAALDYVETALTVWRNFFAVTLSPELLFEDALPFEMSDVIEDIRARFVKSDEYNLPMPIGGFASEVQTILELRAVAQHFVKQRQCIFDILTSESVANTIAQFQRTNSITHTPNGLRRMKSELQKLDPLANPNAMWLIHSIEKDLELRAKYEPMAKAFLYLDQVSNSLRAEIENLQKEEKAIMEEIKKTWGEDRQNAA